MNELLKVESLEGALTYITFSEKDLFFWTNFLGYRIRFPRKMKKRLSVKEMLLKEYVMRMQRLVQWQLDYPDLSPHVRIEIGKLKEKYAALSVEAERS